MLHRHPDLPQPRHHVRHEALQHGDGLGQHLEHAHHRVARLDVGYGGGHGGGVAQGAALQAVPAQERQLRVQLELLVPPAQWISNTASNEGSRRLREVLQ